MATDVPQMTESVAVSDDLKIRKNLRSAVITENDPLKIKLKISKKDIVESVKNKKENIGEIKINRSHRHTISGTFDEKYVEENLEQAIKENDGEPKMKLRSKKEADEELDQKILDNEDIKDDKKKKTHKSDESFCEPNEVLPKIKKRGRPSKSQIEGNEKLEERKRLKRIEGDLSDKERNINENSNLKESFCWTCHKDGSVVKCDTCPRVFHLKCVSLSKDPSKDWICPECSLVLHAEKMSTRSEAMKNLSLDQLCTLLSFAIGRMKNVPESQAFWKPVDPKEVPHYDKYITNPMDLNLLEKNMKAKMYGSPQAFLADAKWLLHNSIIFNSTQSTLTSTARFLVKICKQEMAEIENCPDCYLNAHTKKDWFVEVCRKPHILIWARLKGFPFWPAKAMSTNLKTQSVDARFFGAHDKAWVPVKECYLYSKNSPQLLNKKRSDLDDAFIEVESYIKKIRQKYGTFCYAPDKVHFVPEMYDNQLKSMIPSYQEEKAPKKKRKRQITEENGIMDKSNDTGKKFTEHVTHRFKVKRMNSQDSGKVSEDVCLINDYISDEKILSEDKISPEDEIARTLEMYDTAAEVNRVNADENSTDIEEESSVPIPEHGYSRSFDTENEVKSDSTPKNDESHTKPTCEMVITSEKADEISSEKNEVTEITSDNKDVSNEVDICKKDISSGVVEEGTHLSATMKEDSRKESENDQCVVSSTSAESSDMPGDAGIEENQVNDKTTHSTNEKPDDHSTAEQQKKSDVEQKECEESSKKDEDRSVKSFTNLSINQKQKILTEAKLLANIDEMTAIRKKKVLNDLGLDASLVDIKLLAQENREILQTLNKKGHGETNDIEDIPIKSEDFEQYLMEESNQESEVIPTEQKEPPSRRFGSIKVRDIQTLAQNRNTSGSSKNHSESALKLTGVESVKDMKSNKKDFKFQKKKGSDDSNAKKLKLEPVVELKKLEVYEKSLQKLNKKLRLSNEVSLLMVESDKKRALDDKDNGSNKPSIKVYSRRPRARKSMPNRTRMMENPSSGIYCTKPSNVNVISVDTENSGAQKNLLKSLCVEDQKVDDDSGNRTSKKTVLITTNDKGIENVDVTTVEDTSNKSVNGVTVETFGGNGKGNDNLKDGIPLGQQKNLTVVTNSHLILTSSGPTYLANQNNQPNLALTQNNMGHLSLVHLTNLSSGIQTNFVNLTNETIGLNNSLGAIYASPNFSTDGACSSVPTTGSSPLFLTTSPSSSAICAHGASNLPSSKSTKGSTEGTKSPISRSSSTRQSSGISVKSPASLGLTTTQANKVPLVMTKTVEENFGAVGSVTAELNRHSVKMAEYMRATIEDILRELSNQGSLEAKYKSLAIEMEKLKWKHQQEIMELKHHSERSLLELRTTLENEKQKCLAELKSQLEARHQKIISETKNKQWCANCGKEALFYCCWNTSYCDYPCQQQHWPGHMGRCAQLRNNIQASNQLQNKNPSLKYQNSGYAPMISRAGGSHSSGPFASNRPITNVQGLSQGRRTSDPPAPQIPINITIRPQHYFM